MRRIIPVIAILLMAGIAAACTPAAATPVPLPTAKVPTLNEINGAFDRWKSGDNQDYFVSVEETTPAGTSLYRIVIADGVIRAAQRIDRLEGQWSPPVAIDSETAVRYTIDALFERLLADATGQGAAPLNMFVVFDNISGFPTLVEAKALPSYTGDGGLKLNREHSYTLSIEVNVLIEDTFGLDRTPLMSLQLSGGPNAACSNLRIFADGSSIYSDDCRQILLQLRPPEDLFERLQALSSETGAFTDARTSDATSQNLALNGTGSGTAAGEALDEIWELAIKLNDLLSQPVGAGITLLRTAGDSLIGVDMRTNLEQPATLALSPPFYGGVTDSIGLLLVYGDSEGLKWLNTRTGESGKYFSNPPGRWFVPVAITADGRVVLERSGSDGVEAEWGWVSLEERSWHPLPDVGGCIEHVAANRVDARLAISTRVDAGCNAETALWVVDLASETVIPVISAAFNAVSADWSPEGEWLAVVLEDIDAGLIPAPAGLYRLRPGGSELSAITGNTMGRVTGAVWSPEGEALFYGISGAETQSDGLYEFDIDAGQTARSLEGENLRPLSFAPSGDFLAFLEGSQLRVWVLSFGRVIPISPAVGPESLFVGWLDAGAGQ